MLDNNNKSSTKQIKSEIVDLFHIIDTANKGYITSDDVKNAPKLLPRDILDVIAIDDDNRLTLEEFAVAYTNLTRNEHDNGNEEENDIEEGEDEDEEEEDFDNLFKLYANRDFITREDILKENLHISNDLFEQMDIDGDGKLTLEEYKRATSNNNNNNNNKPTNNNNKPILTNGKIEEISIKENKRKKTRSSIKDKLLKGFKQKTPLFKTLSNSFNSETNQVKNKTSSQLGTESINGSILSLNKKNSSENIDTATTASNEKSKQESIRQKLKSIKRFSKHFDTNSKKSSEGSIVENDMNGFHQQQSNHIHSDESLSKIDELLEKITLLKQELYEEREARNKIENEYNNMKIDLRFSVEKQLELEDEIRTLNKEKDDLEQENRKLTYLNSVLEEKLERTNETLDNLNKSITINKPTIDENKSNDLKETLDDPEIKEKENVKKEMIPPNLNISNSKSKRVTRTSTFKEVPDFMNPDRKFKFILLGNSGVGKTSFMKRICRDTFNDSLNSTIGFDFDQKAFYIDNKVVKIDIWDTAGQERYGAMTKAYYRGAHCFICMYDVNEENSFLNLRNWITSINEATDDLCQIVIIGNKIDLIESVDDRAVRYADGVSLAEENNALYYEVSTKAGLNVCESIESMTRVLMKKISKSETICDKKVNLDKKPIYFNNRDIYEKKESSCC